MSHGAAKETLGRLTKKANQTGIIRGEVCQPAADFYICDVRLISRFPFWRTCTYLLKCALMLFSKTSLHIIKRV